jgi:hypothetical protein
MFSAPCNRCDGRMMTNNYHTLTQYGWSILDASIKPALVLCFECTQKEIESRRQLLMWQQVATEKQPKSTTTTTGGYETWVSTDPAQPVNRFVSDMGSDEKAKVETHETVIVFDDGTRELLYLTKFSLDVLIKQLEDRYEDNYEKWTRLTHYVGETRHVLVAMIDDIHHLV